MSLSHEQRAPNRTLSHYYTSQTRLGDFIPTLFPVSTDLGLVREDDSSAYRTLLNDTLVCLVPGYESRIWEGVEPADGAMSEMLNRAIVHIFKTSKDGKPNNQITNGFTGSSFAYSLVGNAHATWNEQRPGIYSKHLNTNNSTFAKRTWATLASRIGPGPFHHLLTCTSVFLSLPNECLSQLTGMPMIDLTPLDSTIARLGKRTREPRVLDEDEEALWRDLSPPLNKKRRRRPKKTRTSAKDEEEEDAEMLDADVTMEISMGDAFAFEEPIKIKKKPCSRREPVQQRSPADITFVRTRIFYARSLKKAGRSEPEKRVLVGLPPNHILSHLQPQALPDVPHSTPNPPKLSPSDSTLLLKYLFPRQFSLHNVFTSALAPTASKSSHTFPDYTSRKDELERRKQDKTSSKAGEGRRVKGDKLRALVEEMWKRHGECDYWRLRAICCPSKVVLGAPKPTVADLADLSLSQIEAGDGPEDSLSREMADTTLPLEFVSQPPPNATESSQADRSSTTLHLQSQVPFSSLDVSHDSLVVPQGPDEKEVEERKKKQKFKNFTQSTGQVARFATQVIKRVVPLAFFGSEANRKLILSHVDVFIALRRFESLSLHTVMQGLSISDCAWLAPDNLKQGERVSASDAAKRREILQEFIYWLFDSFLIPLLKTTFYVTESAAFKKQVLYFRQDDWEVICKPLFSQLQTSAYQKLDKAEVARTADGAARQLGHSYVRLLPKENGVRPLINLRRVPKTKAGEPVRDAKGGFVKSINATLKDTFSILVQSKDSDPSLFGASILGADDIYPKLKQFKKRTTSPDGSCPPYFFVKVDVRSCFDTIDQTKLMQILEEMLEADDGFSVVRFNKAKLSGGHVRKKFLQRAFPKVDSPTFPELADDLAKRHHREILMDKAYETSHDKDDALSLLREHITNNLIKMGPDFFRQSKGIPQGSIVSTHLCSFFYADMERRYLGFTAADDCMLVRLVDDFLLVTTNKDKAVRFVRTMHHGHPDYGCYVSREKTLINFECRLEDEDNPTVTSSTDFPWCGRLIDMRHLHVKGDYSRDSTHIKNTLTVNDVRHPGLTIRAKVFRNIAQKSSICFNDTVLNTPRVVYLNIYQNFVFCAMKTVWYVKELRNAAGGDGGGRELGNVFLLDTIREAGDFTFNTVKNGARSRDAREQGGQVDVEKQVVAWLAHHAFLSVFATKPTLFRALLSALRQTVEIDPVGREFGVRWKDLVEESWRGMRGVVF